MELRAQAVLFRTGHDSDLLELELTRRGIPVRQVRRPAVPGGRACQGLRRAAARSTDNPADEVSWFRLLQLLDGVGPIRARRMLDALRGPDGGPPELGRWPDAAAHVPESALEHAGALIEALAGTGAGSAAGAGAQRRAAVARRSPR